jgi:hypothetical protein
MNAFSLYFEDRLTIQEKQDSHKIAAAHGPVHEGPRGQVIDWRAVVSH